MIAATYTQGGGFAVRDVPKPVLGDDEALLRVMASSICGTDLRIIRAGHRKLGDGQTIVLGHEFAGVIEAAGKNVNGVCRVGQRVGVAPNFGCGRCEMCIRGLANMCPTYDAFGINMDGAHAEYVRLPREAILQGNVVPLPDTLGWVEASLAEPFSCVVNGMDNVRAGLDETVVIVGAGPIGLMHAMLAAAKGAARVIVADLNEPRLGVARGLGATDVVCASGEALRGEVMRLTRGRGADVVVTACSAPEAQEQALSLLAPYGRLSLFGGLPAGKTANMDTNQIHYKNLMVTGSTGGSTANFRTALDLIGSGQIAIRRLASHIFPASQMAEAFESALRAEGLKTVITHGECGPK